MSAPVSPAAKEIEVEVVTPGTRPAGAGAPADEWLRLLSFVMDNLFKVPGTNRRFGLDPIIGLLPGIGDGANGALGALTLLRAAQRGVPKVVVARMALNILLDSGVSAVPVVGDAFSFWFKSFQRNFELLEKHGNGVARPPSLGDRIFVWTAVALVIAVPVALILLLGAVWYKIFRWALG